MKDDFKPVAVGGNADPSPSSSPLQQGERQFVSLAGGAPALQLQQGEISSCWQAGRLPYNQTKYEIDLLPVHVVAASVCEACRCRFDRLLVTSPKYRYVSLAPTPRSQAEPGAMPQESGVADNQALKARRS